MVMTAERRAMTSACCGVICSDRDRKKQMTATSMPPAGARTVSIQWTGAAVEPTDSSPAIGRGESNGRRMTIFFRRPTIAKPSSNRQLAVVMHGDVAAAIEHHFQAKATGPTVLDNIAAEE